jgi:hypothetical protein
MSIPPKFKALVHDLDRETLAELSRLVASEMARHAKKEFQINDIHPRMTAAEKERAALEIAQVLKEQG